jgi:hypothetical protein
VLSGRPTQSGEIESPTTPVRLVPDAPASVARARSLPSLAAADTSARASRRRALVVSAVVGAVAAFALAAGALTIYEALTGHALSGGSGTTFSQVQHDGPEARPTAKQTPTPSESADPSATAEPSVTPKAASPTAEPTETPSVQPSVTPTSEPTATTAPPSAAPSQTPGLPR